MQMTLGEQSLKAKTHSRFMSQSVSRYANIPTENIKFKKFIELLFNSKMN